MKSILCVAEKPSVARSISFLLSQNVQIENTASTYNKMFRFIYPFQDQEHQFLFTSVAGHLKGYQYPEKYKKWSDWDPTFILSQAELEYNIQKDKTNLQVNLKNYSKQSQILMLWLDCDREGENIAFEVLDVCKQANPRLQVFRAHFSALTRADIVKALNTLRQPDKALSDAVEARQELDLRIGASFTRFQSLLLRKSYSLQGVISYGPCQFPTLGFVVERHRIIDNFKPEKFWYIKYVHKWTDSNGKAQVNEFNWERDRIYSEYESLVLYEMCVQGTNPQQSSCVAVVKNVEKNQTQKWKPLPLATIEFEKLATKNLRISAHQAMEIAEKLYNKGYISYPRTETNKFSQTMNLKDILGAQKRSSDWGDYVSNLLDYGGYENPRAGSKDDKAHPPIHPVKCLDRNQAESDLEYKIYELITRHFIACCSKNAIGNETQINIGINQEGFKLKGLQIEQENYLQIYPYDKWSQSVVPNMQKGAQFQIDPKQLTLESGQTSAPKPLTETELITLMDKKGIGTDATIHEHIKTIQDREYAIKTGQVFQPTKLGIALVESYHKLGFTLHLPELRATMEEKMNLVAQGLKPKNDFIKETIDEMEAILKQLQTRQQDFVQTVGQHLDRLQNYTIDDQGNEVPLREQQMGLCGSCQTQMNLREMADGEKHISCPSCKKQYRLPREGTIHYRPETCPLCQCQILEVKKEDNKHYTLCPSCYNYPPNQDGLERMPCFVCTHPTCQFSSSQKGAGSPFNCQVCKSPMVIRQSKTNGIFIGCSGYPKCKSTLNLPGFVKKAIVTDTNCNICRSKMVKLQFQEDEILFGQLAQRAADMEGLWCISPGCDPLIGSQIKQSQPQNQQRQPIQSQPQQNPQRQNQQRNRMIEEKPKVQLEYEEYTINLNPEFNQIPTEASTRNSNNNISNTQNQTETRPCYICQQTGHWANACPQKNQKQQRPQVNNQRIQNQNQNQNMQNLTCYKCKQPGHIAPQCPKNNNMSYHNEQQAPKNMEKKEQKEKKVCQECGVLGRHPKNSECNAQKKKKKKEN